MGLTITISGQHAVSQPRRMTAVFAGTFFWIALADLTGTAHRRALDSAIDRADSQASASCRKAAKVIFRAWPSTPRGPIEGTV